MTAPDFRALFDALPGLYLVLLPDDPVFTIVIANQAYAKATLVDPDRIAGRPLFEVFPDNPDDPNASGVENLSASLRQVIATKAAHTMPAQKYDIRRPESLGGGFEERYWSPVNTPIVEGGKVRFIIHRVEDVTELLRLKRMEAEQGKLTGELRERAVRMEADLLLRGRQLAESQRLMRERQEVEEKLQASEARFGLAFAQAPIGMVLLTPEGRIVEVNQAYIDALGYTREELIEYDSSRYTHPGDVALTRQFFAELRAGPHHTGSIEKRYFRKDGELMWAKASATMRRDEAGRPAQVIAIVEDITARKRAEERLWESQQQLRAIYDSTYEYIGLIDPAGTVLDCNRASLEFAGNTREDVVGRPFWETPWFAATAGAGETVRQGVAQAAAGEFVRYEANLIRPATGEVLIFDFSIYPVRNERGEVVSLVPEGRDITERKETAARDAFLVGLDDATRTLFEAREIVQTAARLLGEHLRVNRCAYAEVEDDRNTLNLTGDFHRGVPSMVGRYTLDQFGEECALHLLEGKPFVVEDSETASLVAAVADNYRLARIRSAIWIPLLKGGALVAVLAVNDKAPRRWRPNEIELVQLVASRCWESIERVRVARELREREQRFRFLAESIPQMVWTAAPDGMLDYLNGQGASYFGLPPDKLLGAGWLEMVHPDEREQTLERWKHSLQTGEPYETAFRLKRGSDSMWRLHLVRALPLAGENGRIEQWFGTCTDIEDQKQADVKLHQQWQTFDTAFRTLPISPTPSICGAASLMSIARCSRCGRNRSTRRWEKTFSSWNIRRNWPSNCNRKSSR